MHPSMFGQGVPVTEGGAADVARELHGLLYHFRSTEA
jgi:hypothetical protein